MEFDGLDLGSLAEFGDIGGFPDLSGLDVGGLDLGALADLGDIGGFADLGGLDIGGLDLGALAEFGDIGGFADLGGLDVGGLDLGALADMGDVGGFSDYNLTDFGDIGGFPGVESAEDRAARLLEEYKSLPGGGVQDLGTTMSPTDEQGRLQLSGYDEGRLPSQWQKVGDSDLRVMIQDDGSGIGINPATGTQFGLEREQVQNLVKEGLLNTYKSGYFTATGGTKNAPGGGITTTKDGKTFTLKPDGKVYDTNTGKVITNTNTIREVINQIKTTGGTGGVSTAPGMPQQNLLSSLLPLLMMMMAMNRGSSGSSTPTGTIPALAAAQSQTPYSQIQQAPGYRPGQGGITYFNPVQYMPKMAGGGIIDLARALAAKRREQRQGLLKGRGDGTSDSIPAMIGKDQPARLARGEYVVDARTVAELGNGSTDAGAERLDEMRKRVHAKRKTAKVGQDSKASKELPA